MSFAHQVIDFNQKVLKIEVRVHAPLAVHEHDISIKCLEEEIREFKEAHETGDFIGQIDAIIDLQYFAMGMLYKMGLTGEQIDRCMTAVHEANMEKKLGVVARRGDGTAADAVKPTDWVAPEQRIGEILES